MKIRPYDKLDWYVNEPEIYEQMRDIFFKLCKWLAEKNLLEPDSAKEYSSHIPDD